MLTVFVPVPDFCSTSICSIRYEEGILAGLLMTKTALLAEGKNKIYKIDETSTGLAR